MPACCMPLGGATSCRGHHQSAASSFCIKMMQMALRNACHRMQATAGCRPLRHAHHNHRTFPEVARPSCHSVTPLPDDKSVLARHISIYYIQLYVVRRLSSTRHPLDDLPYLVKYAAAPGRAAPGRRQATRVRHAHGAATADADGPCWRRAGAGGRRIGAAAAGAAAVDAGALLVGGQLPVDA